MRPLTKYWQLETVVGQSFKLLLGVSTNAAVLILKASFVLAAPSSKPVMLKPIATSACRPVILQSCPAALFELMQDTDMYYLCNAVVPFNIMLQRHPKFSVCGCSSSCTVCCDDYESGDALRVLTCGHKYHVECIDKWLLSSIDYLRTPACPICNAVLLEERC